ncbi:MAG: methionine--tRNA ligase [Desulfobacterales bacterium]|nr:methionine--tRNA ligase [Desulfobacterales bacterium]
MQESKNKFYVTTPIYYVNAKPHLGHAYTTIAADVANRFRKVKGFDTFFLTGTDEHGDKIVEAAEKNGIKPKEYTDQISKLFSDLWPNISIENDYFIRTTDEDHKNIVKGILQKIYDSGDIYFSEYEGLYCKGCERFYQERELVDGLCPDHKKAPEVIKEANYFFKMSKYQNWLIDHINQNEGFIRPARYKNEVLSFLKEPLEDLCISRPKTRLTWGITLPFDENYVTYVWFDALVNYISALNYPGDMFNKYWSSVQHIVAKDILKPHGIYWPIMLKSAGLPIYNNLNVHGFWNIGKEKDKMSKSLGNVVDPGHMVEKYGSDQFRYFLMREMVFGLDANYSEEVIIKRINSDLSNDFGNLCNRVFSMTHRYFEGIVPEKSDQIEESNNLSLDQEKNEMIDAYLKEMELFSFHKGLESVWVFIRRMNKYVDEKAPWTLAKESKTDQLSCVIYNLLEGVRVVAGLLYPVLPKSYVKIMDMLGLTESTNLFEIEKIKFKDFLVSGNKINESEILFPTIEEEKVEEKKQSLAKLKNLKDEITYEDFMKIDLRVGVVTHAEPVKKSDRLLKVKVDIGEERELVAGISKSYSAEDIIGKSVVVVANLKKAKIMGIESNGMMLAASEKKNLTLITLDKDVKKGSQVA